MPHALSTIDAAPADEAPVITTFDGRRLAVRFRVDTVTDLARMTPAGHRVRPSLIDAATGQPLGAADRTSLLASDMERADMAAIAHGIDWLTAGGGGPALILTMSFLSASSQRARTNLLLRAARLQHQAKTPVIWLLTDIPDGAPVSRLSELVALLRPFGRAVFAETRFSGLALKGARAARMAGLVIAPPRPDLCDTDAALWLLQAGKLAERAAPTLIADGLPSPDLLPVAAAAGFTHAIAPSP